MTIALWMFAVIAPLAAGLSSCAAPSTPAAEAAPPVPPYTASATVKDIMLHIIDPAADDVWLAVSTVSTAAGTVETVPTNDEEWLKARRGALTLIEASNLLMIPGRNVARPGEKSEAPGVELEPHEMQANIAKDLPEYYKAARRLHDAAAQALGAIEAKDAPKLFELGETIENACEYCHSRYWYPNEKIPAIIQPPPDQAAPPASK
jgi:hypothetical protein